MIYFFYVLNKLCVITIGNPTNNFQTAQYYTAISLLFLMQNNMSKEVIHE